MADRNIGIIQARMGSLRFPGKMLSNLGSYNIIEWVIKRVSNSVYLDDIFLATSDLETDDCLCSIAEENNIYVYRGSHLNVLSRFESLIYTHKPSNIVRICADNPFIDPLEVDKLIQYFISNNFDYCFNNQARLNCDIADGFGAEIFSFSAFHNIVNSDLDPDHREHVTKYIWDNLDKFSISSPPISKDLAYPLLKFDVDVPSDLKYLNRLITSGISLQTTASEIVKLALLNEFLPHESILDEINRYLSLLFPICRSITGQGNRDSLEILSKLIPLKVHEVPSGTSVFDWTIPQEWNIRDAFIADELGNRIICFSNSNIHVVSYSEPINTWMSWEDLSPHLHYDSKRPHWIPYRTSYYKKAWGFSVTYIQYQKLSQLSGKLHVVIDSEFTDGSLTYADFLIKGSSPKEVLISSYICHPSMANDSLSGIVLSTFLARYLRRHKNLKWSYRFVFVPETIGSICYLQQHYDKLKNIDFGFVITTVGGPGYLSYKQSWNSEHFINNVVEQALRAQGSNFSIFDFDIHGSDERQYSSPGFRINCASICKDKYYEYPQYHTSADNLDFVLPENILISLKIYIEVITQLERIDIFVRTEACGEIMLSKYGLYPQLGGAMTPNSSKLNNTDLLLGVLFYTDGLLSIECIASKLSVEYSTVSSIYATLEEKGIVRKL